MKHEMRLTIAYSKIKKRNLVLINNDTHQRETVSERPIRPPLRARKSEIGPMFVSYHSSFVQYFDNLISVWWCTCIKIKLSCSSTDTFMYHVSLRRTKTKTKKKRRVFESVLFELKPASTFRSYYSQTLYSVKSEYRTFKKAQSAWSEVCIFLLILCVKHFSAILIFNINITTICVQTNIIFIFDLWVM